MAQAIWRAAVVSAILSLVAIDAAPASPRCLVTDPAGTPLPECRGDQGGAPRPPPPQTLKQFLASQDGVTSIEYALIASLIAIVIIAAVQGVGTQLSTVFTEVGNSLK